MPIAAIPAVNFSEAPFRPSCHGRGRATRPANKRHATTTDTSTITVPAAVSPGEPASVVTAAALRTPARMLSVSSPKVRPAARPATGSQSGQRGNPPVAGGGGGGGASITGGGASIGSKYARQLGEARDVAPAAVAVDQHGAHAGRLRARHVLSGRVAHVHRLRRLAAGRLERGLEDRRGGLVGADHS